MQDIASEIALNEGEKRKDKDLSCRARIRAEAAVASHLRRVTCFAGHRHPKLDAQVTF